MVKKELLNANEARTISLKNKQKAEKEFKREQGLKDKIKKGTYLNKIKETVLRELPPGSHTLNGILAHVNKFIGKEGGVTNYTTEIMSLVRTDSKYSLSDLNNLLEENCVTEEDIIQTSNKAIYSLKKKLEKLGYKVSFQRGTSYDFSGGGIVDEPTIEYCYFTLEFKVEW